MAETEDDAAEAVERLHAALERIAVLAKRRPARGDSDAVKAEAAARLDALIAQLRAALDGSTDTAMTESR